jgi:hypothetical protein
MMRRTLRWALWGLLALVLALVLFGLAWLVVDWSLRRAVERLAGG